LFFFFGGFSGFAGAVDCESCAAAFGEFSCEAVGADDCSTRGSSCARHGMLAE
jgi:hypothetical protein